MALPTGSQIQALDFAFAGAPFVSFAKSDPNGLDIGFEGSSFWAQGFSGAGAVGTTATLRWDLDGAVEGGGSAATLGFFMLM